MSGHWHKVVSGACKPKHAVPKTKYLEPLIGCTYNSDGSFADVTRSLSLRLRDPSPTITFKALLVMHTLIRQGNLDEVFPYWSGSDGKDGSRSLGLLGWVNAAASGAMDTPKNFVRYGHYLGARLKCYAALKHDPIRTRAEAPASLRRSFGGGGGAYGPNRLRTLTVERGLLREVTTLQKLLDSLIECKFAPEDTNDELIVMALRMLVKDLLILFQAVNEGVINVLEHYFEMSKVDATTSLKTYKIFCRQCEKVVAYLGVAKSLAGVLNVNIPNLRHAPVSLAGSLQEYLDDPNFEKNREEYRDSKLVADGKQPAPKEPPKEPAASTSSSAAPAPVSKPADSAPKPSFQDFFASIESEQQSMFNPQTGSPTFGQNSTYNPFTGQQVAPLVMTQSPSYGSMLFAQQTGMPSTSMGQGFAPPVQVQQTGFAMGGQMGMAPNGMPPQMTGHNPFRQSMMVPPPSAAPAMMMPQQSTGNPFGLQQPSTTGGGGHNPFRQSTAGFPTAFTGAQPPPNRANGAMSAPPPSLPDPFSSFATASSSAAPPLPSSPSPAPVLAQPTGSRNPFAPPPGSAPPAPPGQAGPSLNTLAMSAWQRDAREAQVRQEAARLQAEQAAAKQKQAEANAPAGANGTSKPANDGGAAFADFFSAQIGRLEGGGKDVQQAQKTGGGGLFSNVASEFATTRPKTDPAPSSSSAAMGTEPTFAFTNPTGSMGPQPTGSISPFGAPGGQRTSSPGPMQPQTTGFGGSLVKPFKPSSSFGTSLASSLPPLHEEAPPMPPFGTGTGGPNPFRASTLTPTATGVVDTSPARRGTLAGFAPGLVSQPTGYPGAAAGVAPQQQQPPTLTSDPTGFGGIRPFQPTSSFGQSSFSSAPTNGIQSSAPPPVSLI